LVERKLPKLEVAGSTPVRRLLAPVQPNNRKACAATRIAARFPLCAAVLLVCGCGGSARALPAARLTRQQVVAYAAGVNLHEADLPGLTAGSGEPEREVHEEAEEREVARCMGVSIRGQDVVRVVSPTLDDGELSATSSVAVNLNDPPGAAGAMAAYARVRANASRRGVACVQRFLQRSYVRSGSGHAQVSVQRDPLSGFDGTFGARFRLTGVHPELVGLPGRRSRVATPIFPMAGTVTVYIDVRLFAAGRAAVELESIDGTPGFLTATDRRLLSLLHIRSAAHPL
jgi:hypothetical protein